MRDDSPDWKSDLTESQSSFRPAQKLGTNQADSLTEALPLEKLIDGIVDDARKKSSQYLYETKVDCNGE